CARCPAVRRLLNRGGMRVIEEPPDTVAPGLHLQLAFAFEQRCSHKTVHTVEVGYELMLGVPADIGLSGMRRPQLLADQFAYLLVGSRTRRAERQSSNDRHRPRIENVRSFSSGHESRQPEYTEDCEVQKAGVHMDLPDPSVHIAVQFTR